MKHYRAFSLIELLIGLIIISVAIAAFAPILSKRAKAQNSSVASKITNNCPEFGGKCALCYRDNADCAGNEERQCKKCIACKISCARDEALNETTCECEFKGNTEAHVVYPGE